MKIYNTQKKQRLNGAKLISIFVFLYFIFYILNPHSAQAAKVYFSPMQAEIAEGASFVTEIRLDTEGENINAVDFQITFPFNILEIVELNIGGSVLSLYPVKPEYSNMLGSVSLQAGAPNGFEGDGLVARIFFKAKNKGSAAVRFSENSEAYLSDGFGTAAVLERIAANYTVGERRDDFLALSSISFPEEAVWYSKSIIDITWKVESGISYSYVLSSDPGEVPDEVADFPIGQVTFAPEEDGIFYFHLRRCESGECGSTSTRSIFKDTVPPEPFQIQLGQDATAFGGKRFLVALVTDKTSGIDHYEVSEIRNGKRGIWETVDLPYVLNETVEIETIELKAVDRAGNERIVSFPLQTTSIGYNNYLSFGIISGIGILILYIVFRRLRKYIFKV